MIIEKQKVCANIRHAEISAQKIFKNRKNRCCFFEFIFRVIFHLYVLKHQSILFWYLKHEFVTWNLDVRLPTDDEI